MKKIIYILLCIPLFSYTQVTVTDANLPQIGDTVITAYESGNYLPGNSGANQNWDFSTATGTIDMVLGFIDPNSTPFAGVFPNSNICAQIDSAAYYYLNTSTNGLATVGFVDQGQIYPYNKMLLPTPLNYLDTIDNTQIIYQYDTVFTPPIPAFWAGIPGPYVIDSVKQIYGNTDKFIVDGWGQVELPNGVFEALRVFETSFEFDNSLLKITDTITGTSQWIQDPNSGGGTSWNESKYTWRTNDSTVNFNLVEIELDSLGNSYGEIIYYMGNSISNIVISPPLVEEDVVIDADCYGEATGKIILDVIGTATPFYFSWTGPNGFTSTNQDIFNLVSGLYTVTVTDGNGNSNSESFYVDEPPLLTLSINQNNLDLTAYASGGIPPYSYLWSPTNDTLATITINANGIYSCDVIDKKGCITTATFTVSNVPTGITEINTNRKLIKIVDVLGREKTIIENNESLFYIYDDGTVEKKIIFK